MEVFCQGKGLFLQQGRKIAIKWPLFAHVYESLRPHTHGGESLLNNLVFWQIILFWDANLQKSGTFCTCVRALMQFEHSDRRILRL